MVTHRAPYFAASEPIITVFQFRLRVPKRSMARVMEFIALLSAWVAYERVTKVMELIAIRHSRP